MRDMQRTDWVTAFKSGSIRALVEQRHLQLDLFDERNLLKRTSPDYPGESLMACRNPHLAKKRALTREDSLATTERGLAKFGTRFAAGTLTGADAIRVCVGRIINQYHVAKTPGAHDQRPRLLPCPKRRAYRGGSRARRPVHHLHLAVGHTDGGSAVRANL